MTAHPAAGLADGLADGAARDLVDRLVSRPAVAGVVGVGIDAVDLARLRTVLARRPRLSGRLFTPGEQAYAALAPDPVPRLGTRFAAKEAVMKALGVGLWSFRLTDVEVVRIGLDAPGVVLHGAAADLARAAGVRRWHLSLTHTDSLALAAVVADGTPGEPVAGADAVEGP